jgi:hexosaminidase
MRNLVVMLMLCVASVPQTGTQSARPINLMPVPASLQVGAGQLVFGPMFSVAITGHTEPRLQRAVDIFLTDLRRQCGMLPADTTVADPSSATLVIHSEDGSKEVQEVGEDESYALEVTPNNAQLSAPTTLGVMRGLQTFLQLVDIGPNGFSVPAVTIKDQPRFPWRGLMIDVGRHFMPLDVLKRNLDGMAAVKMNVFHWHLSENQGFRVESKRFLKLHEMGSDGLYYTQDEVREVITYARDRGIRVIPEFDMPGHSTAWFVGYPDLASGHGHYEIERKWGIFDPAMDPTKDSTYRFLDEFIGEMARLFPDQYFHIGGDEVNGKEWDKNPKIQEFMRAHAIKSNADLQAYFNRRVQAIVSKHGKTMEGWEEILRPDLPKSIVIQSWRGQDSLAAAAKQGYRGLLSFGYYVDLNWPTWQHYEVDPMAKAAADLGDEEKQRILGGEAAMWAEYVSPENIDSRIWPRTAAIAERLWSPRDVRDVDSMYQRMGVISHRLDWLGLTHNSNYVPMLRRMTGTDDVSALRTLADVVEPVKDYTREELAERTPVSSDPLNRLVDAARPESMTARRFAALVDAFMAGDSKPGTEAEIRTLLGRWRDQQVELQPLADESFLVKEALPLSRSLSMLGTAGLAALEYMDHGERAPAAWKAEQLAFIEQAKKPKAQLLLVVAPSVQKLVEASAAAGSASYAK